MISQTTKETIGIVAGVIQGLTLIPYVVRLLRKGTESSPSIASVGIWLLLGVISLAGYFLQTSPEHREAVWIPAMCVFNPLVVFVIATRIGTFKPLDDDDRWSLRLAFVAAGLLAAFHGSVVGLVASIAGDFIGTRATVRNVREHPHAEPFWPWAIFSGACVLNLFAVDWREAGATYNAYITVAGLWVTAEIGYAQVAMAARAR